MNKSSFDLRRGFLVEINWRCRERDAELSFQQNEEV